MIDSNIILLICSCDKYILKAQYQKLTWLKTFQSICSDIPFFHIVGRPNMNSKYKFDHDQHILFVQTNDDYNSLPSKMLAAFDAIEREYSYLYIFKTDDDQMVSNVNFFNHLSSLLIQQYNTPNSIHYGGQVIDVKMPHVSEYWQLHPELPKNLLIKPTKYCSGRFYFISSQAVKELLPRRPARS